MRGMKMIQVKGKDFSTPSSFAKASDDFGRNDKSVNPELRLLLFRNKRGSGDQRISDSLAPLHSFPPSVEGHDYG